MGCARGIKTLYLEQHHWVRARGVDVNEEARQATSKDFALAHVLSLLELAHEGFA
jgi:hypothetical protein